MCGHKLVTEQIWVLVQARPHLMRGWDLAQEYVRLFATS